MVQPWMISVLSTGYDLKEYREEIIELLKKKGFDVSAYEEPDFPVDTTVAPHDNCLTALERADIAIAIINKRSGETYCGGQSNEEGYTITEKEFNTAIERGIPVYVFVHKDAHKDYETYRKKYEKFCNENKDRGTKENTTSLRDQFDATFECRYVDSCKTLHFIDDIQQKCKDNWMSFFDDMSEFKDAVEGKLRGFSRQIIQQLAEKQKSNLMDRHTSTALGMSLGDIFSEGYYIETPHKIISGKNKMRNSDSELWRQITSALSSENSVLVYGEAGYGKTTILAKCFSERVTQLEHNHGYEIPLFLSLRNKGNEYSFDIDLFISDEINELMSKEAYPYFSLKNLKLQIYCDGFDELTESLTEKDIDRISKSSIFRYPLVLTCRQQFVTRYLSEYNFSDKFGVQIQMEKWTIEIAKNYIRNFCDKSNKKIEEKEQILNVIETNTELDELLDSPLLVTMFLWHLENENSEIGMDIISRDELFSSWMINLAKREVSKIHSKSVESMQVLDIWKFIAWNLYVSRVDNKKLRIEDMNDLIKKKNRKNEIFDITQCLNPLFECNGKIISGTFHEQFMEYLVASFLIDACIRKREPYPDFLRMILRPEINRDFREIWKGKTDRDKKKVYDVIHKQYMENIGKTSKEAIKSRVHATYHLCRLESEKREEFINCAFEVEKDISVKLSLYFGAIKMGNLEREEEFYKLLSDDSRYSEANRGYHLAYYADSMNSDAMPYCDDGHSEWKGTLKAFERHFESDKVNHYFLRRIDILTMRELIEKRKKNEPLDTEKLAFFKKQIASCQYALRPQYCSYNEKIEEEFERLKETFKKYKS